ncbi:MAG TPA: hypothetical protein VIV60_28375, partial [Polyangiaceae bacterium]
QQEKLLERQLEQQRAELLAQLAESTSQRNDTEQLLAQARRRIEDLTAAQKTEDPEQRSELLALEQQLMERGARIRELERDLRRTEELAAQMVREIERLHEAQARSSSEMTSATAVEALEPAGPPLSCVAQSNSVVTPIVATDNWSQEATSPTPASTEQSGDQSSAWADKDAADLRGRLNRLSAIAAKQQADLCAYEWRLQQLLAENAQLSETSKRFATLTTELDDARRRLQETQVLFSQLSAQSG